MALTPSTMLALGTPAPDFRLPDPDGRTVALSDFASAPGAARDVHLQPLPVREARARRSSRGSRREYEERGVGIVAISSNDVAAVPGRRSRRDEGGEGSAAGYLFPYLFDETQEVAKAYRAACTPDLFLFDGARRLVYRGQFDDSRPGSGVPVTGNDLRAALDAVLAGRPVRPEQRPSIGCNIKWKPGNEPDYFAARDAEELAVAAGGAAGGPVQGERLRVARGGHARPRGRPGARRAAWLSLDPTNRGWAAGDTYMPAVEIGDRDARLRPRPRRRVAGAGAGRG